MSRPNGCAARVVLAYLAGKQITPLSICTPLPSTRLPLEETNIRRFFLSFLIDDCNRHIVLAGCHGDPAGFASMAVVPVDLISEDFLVCQLMRLRNRAKGRTARRFLDYHYSSCSIARIWVSGAFQDKGHHQRPVSVTVQWSCLTAIKPVMLSFLQRALVTIVHLCTLMHKQRHLYIYKCTCSGCALRSWSLRPRQSSLPWQHILLRRPCSCIRLLLSMQIGLQHP